MGVLNIRQSKENVTHHINCQAQERTRVKLQTRLSSNLRAFSPEMLTMEAVKLTRTGGSSEVLPEPLLVLCDSTRTKLA